MSDQRPGAVLTVAGGTGGVQVYLDLVKSGYRLCLVEMTFTQFRMSMSRGSSGFLS